VQTVEVAIVCGAAHGQTTNEMSQTT